MIAGTKHPGTIEKRVIRMKQVDKMLMGWPAGERSIPPVDKSTFLAMSVLSHVVCMGVNSNKREANFVNFLLPCVLSNMKEVGRLLDCKR